MTPTQIDLLTPGAIITGPRCTKPRRVIATRRDDATGKVKSVTLAKKRAGMGWQVPYTVYVRSDLYPDSWCLLKSNIKLNRKLCQKRHSTK